MTSAAHEIARLGSDRVSIGARYAPRARKTAKTSSPKRSIPITKASMRILVPTLTTLFLASCGDLLTFDLQAGIDEFTIPGDPYLHHDQAPLEKADIPPIEVRFASFGSGNVQVSGLTFFVTPSAQSDPDDDDSLAFLDAIEVFAVGAEGVNLPPVKIATWTGPAEPGTTSVDLDVVEGVGLNQYVSAGMEFEVRAEGVVPYDDVTLEGVASFRVDPL